MVSKISEIRASNKPLASFIELKHNLLLSYCTFLSFYLLLKVDSSVSDTDIRGHPVLHKITALKQTLDGLQPMDDKLQKAITSKLKKVAPKLAVHEEEATSEKESEDDDGVGDEEDGEEDMSDDYGELTKAEERQLKEEAKKGIADKLKSLEKDEMKAIVKSSTASKKAAIAKLEQEVEAKEKEEKAKKDAKKAKEQKE